MDSAQERDTAPWLRFDPAETQSQDSTSPAQGRPVSVAIQAVPLATEDPPTEDPPPGGVARGTSAGIQGHKSGPTSDPGAGCVVSWCARCSGILQPTVRRPRGRIRWRCWRCPPGPGWRWQDAVDEFVPWPVARRVAAAQEEQIAARLAGLPPPMFCRRDFVPESR